MKKTTAHSQGLNEKEFLELSKKSDSSIWQSRSERLIEAFAVATKIHPFRIGILIPFAERFREILWCGLMAGYPMPIYDDETVEVFSPEGKSVAKKPFRQFTFDDMMQFENDFFWVREALFMPYMAAWKFSEAELNLIERTQVSAKWFERAESSRIEAFKNPRLAELVTAIPRVGKLPHVTSNSRYLGLVSANIRNELPFMPDDDDVYTVYDATGKSVSRKPFMEFTFGEILQFSVGHFWINH